MRKRNLPRPIARSRVAADHYLACLRATGDSILSRRITGITSEDLKSLKAQYQDFAESIEDAELQGKENRLKQATELIEKAHTVALLCEKPADLLEVARTIAPELTIYPQERERARARAEYLQADSQKQVNAALQDLASRLQQVIKESNE